MTAPRERWVLLGKLLEGRRHVLGYTYRYPAFERDTNINRRMSADIEGAARDRIDHFSEGTLRLVAHGYRVLYEWPPGPEGERMRAAAAPRTGPMLAVLRGEADELIQAGQVHASPAYGPAGWQPPIADPVQLAATEPYAMPIMRRLLELARRGVIDPTGEQVFLGTREHPLLSPLGPPGDVEAWDNFIGRRMPPFDRAYFIALLRRDEADRAGNPGASVTGALGSRAVRRAGARGTLVYEVRHRFLDAAWIPLARCP